MVLVEMSFSAYRTLRNNAVPACAKRTGTMLRGRVQAQNLAIAPGTPALRGGVIA